MVDTMCVHLLFKLVNFFRLLGGNMHLTVQWRAVARSLTGRHSIARLEENVFTNGYENENRYQTL